MRPIMAMAEAQGKLMRCAQPAVARCRAVRL